MATPDDKDSSHVRRLILALERIGLKSLSTGNFVWFVVLIIGGGCVWKLSPADLKEVLLKVFATYGWLGYVAAAVVVYAALKTLRWRDRVHQQEVERISQVRNQLMQGKLELPIQSSVERNEPK